MLARELKHHPEEEVKIDEDRKKRIKKAREAQKKKNSILKLFSLFIPIVITGICVSILFRYVNITQVRQEITALEYQKEELEKNKINLIGDLESLKSSPKIAEQAKEKLGMDYPTKDQVVYVNLNEGLNKSETVKKSNPINLIMSKIGNLF